MIRIIKIYLIFLLTFGFSQAQEKYFSQNAMQRHLLFLGSDDCLGRGTGNPGGEKAAQYIAVQLASMGISPFGDSGSFFQKIQIHETTVRPSSRFNFVSKKDTITFKYLDDYVLLKYGRQTYIPQPSDIVFVGYGISAPEYDYNDYHSIDVANKIVVYLEGEPYSEDSTFFAGPKKTLYAYSESKVRTAMAHGARGSIMIAAPPEYGGKTWGEWKKSYKFSEQSLAYAVAGHFSVVISNNTAARIFSSTDYSLQDIYQMRDQHRLKSFTVKGKVSFIGSFDFRDFLASNVIGIKRGKQKRDSYLIVTAHYDHLGIGPEINGDSIYNGVVDNAVGVAALLQIAHAISEAPRCDRSIIFLFVTGEEKGLLGTRHYLDHPKVPLYKTIANINIDGLGIFDTFNSVIGIGTEYSTLDRYLEETTKELGLKLSPMPTDFKGPESFLRSDQAGFAKKGIPAILVMDGPYYNHLSYEDGVNRNLHWMKTRYHTPFDDLKQPLNFNAMQQHCVVLYNLIMRLANSETAPEWKANSPYINARLRSKAEKR